MGAQLDVLSKHAQRTASLTFIDWARFADSRILVTGASGLIGSNVVRTLVIADRLHNLGVSVIAAARDTGKLSLLFSDAGPVSFLRWRAGDPIEVESKVDYVIHAASPTTSRYFVENPLETIDAIALGGRSALELARRDRARAVILSSMEVYGRACGKVDESFGGDFDSLAIRSSYPEAKRFVECTCAAFVHEYGVQACVLRLAQTFGQGVDPYDPRVFAEFARCAMEGKDIVLATDGSKSNPYLSIDDATGAILCSLLNGKPGVAYNAANESTYCSVRDMAEMVMKRYGQDGGSVVLGYGGAEAAKYPDPSEFEMDCSRLRKLGWIAHDSLVDMYDAMYEGWLEPACSPGILNKK